MVYGIFFFVFCLYPTSFPPYGSFDAIESRRERRDTIQPNKKCVGVLFWLILTVLCMFHMNFFAVFSDNKIKIDMKDPFSQFVKIVYIPCIFMLCMVHAVVQKAKTYLTVYGIRLTVNANTALILKFFLTFYTSS